MADIIIHLLVPLLILLLICNKDKHIYIYCLLPLALFPDIDVLYEHRALMHNLFIPTVLLMLRTYYISKKKENIFLFSAIYLYSHAILDIFNGGVKIFYPLYDKMFGIRTDVILTKTNTLGYFFDIGFRDYFSNCYPTVNVITTEGMGILVLTLILFVLRKEIAK